VKIPLAALGIAFDGHCLDCGILIPEEPDWGVARTLCKPCTVQHNVAHAAPCDPLPKTKSGVVIVPPELDTYGSEKIAGVPCVSTFLM